MKKSSKALAKFNKTTVRSLSLIKVYIDHKSAIETNFHAAGAAVETDDLVRSCIVLSVAALDAYFTDVFAEMFIPFLKKRKPTKQMISILSEAGLDTELALEMFSMDRPYRRIRTLINDHHERFVTQNFEKIDGLFLSYGLKDFSKNIQASLNKKQLVRSIEILIQRRHEIVHNGDLNAYGRLQKIDLRKTLKRVMLMVDFVTKADEILMSLIK